MRSTDKTLLEQMKISGVEILRRMELLGLNRKDLNLLASHKAIIEENIEIIVDEFYEKQTKIEEVTLLIGDAETLRRLRAAQRKYIFDLFAGYYDSEYVNNRLRIGMVHKRIGVEPKLYLSAVRTLKEIIIKILKENIESKEILNITLETFDKLLYFDTTLVFDTYINSLVSEIETAKRRTELYAKSLEEEVAERTKQLEEQARLDPLTNIYNQRAMREMLRRDIEFAKRHQKILSLVYLDVDNFKEINDKYGHIKGDEVLKHIGQSMRKSIREVDIPCRYGGDEFCLILPDCNIDSAKIICEKLIKEFSNKYPDLSFSMGIAETGPDEFIDGEQIIKFADQKMYLAKKKSGFQIQA